MIPLISLIMALASFSMIITEFIPAGLTMALGQYFNISISAASKIISSYAIVVAISGPIMSFIMMKLPKKIALLSLIIIFIIGNIIIISSHSFETLLLGRIISAIPCTAFLNLGTVFIVDLVQEKKKNYSVSLMFAAMSIANIVGIPLGIIIGQHFGWRAAFMPPTAMLILSAIMMLLLIPNKSTQSSAVDLKVEISMFFTKRILLTLLTTIIGLSGTAILFSYMVPILVKSSNLEQKYIAYVMGLFTIGSFLASFIGGKIANKNLKLYSIVMIALTIGIELALSVVMDFKNIMVILLPFFSFAAVGMSTSFNAAALFRAKNAPNLAANINVSSFQIAVSIGTWLGGTLMDQNIKFNYFPIIAAGFTFLALLLTLCNFYLDREKMDRPVKPS